MHQLWLWLGEIKGEHLCQLSNTAVHEHVEEVKLLGSEQGWSLSDAGGSGVFYVPGSILSRESCFFGQLQWRDWFLILFSLKSDHYKVWRLVARLLGLGDFFQG